MWFSGVHVFYDVYWNSEQLHQVVDFRFEGATWNIVGHGVQKYDSHSLVLLTLLSRGGG